MKPSHHAEPTQSASTRYAPSVPMSVYRELAAELRANKAVIDSLNSRNQQLLNQNQRLKQEIHSVVQATLNLGQVAGVARPNTPDEFPSEIAPDTLAKLVRAQGEARKTLPADTTGTQPNPPRTAAEPTAATYGITPQPETAPTPQSTPQPRRVPRPIQNTAPQTVQKRKVKKAAKSTARVQPTRQPNQPTAIIPQANPLPKLFTEQTGEYRSANQDSGEEKEIGGIWLALSIILIIVTAFGAGFLIMKPLLNDR
ncbi:MAG: hypothetical protein AAFN12_01740 [Cyanobacteria bacterium J06560_2]